MCIIFTTLTWPENPADAISETLNSKIFLGGMPPDPPNRACFRTLTFRTLHSTIYVALPAPEQVPYSGYAPAWKRLFLHIVHFRSSCKFQHAPFDLPKYAYEAYIGIC